MSDIMAWSFFAGDDGHEKKENALLAFNGYRRFLRTIKKVLGATGEDSKKDHREGVLESRKKRLADDAAHFC